MTRGGLPRWRVGNLSTTDATSNSIDIDTTFTLTCIYYVKTNIRTASAVELEVTSVVKSIGVASAEGGGRVSSTDTVNTGTSS